MKPVKPALSIEQHIALLRSRGMDVDTDLAHQWLTYVSYYRLSAYWYPAKEWRSDGKRDDHFKENTRFCDAVALYEADRKLRSLIHDGMERIEIAMRTRIGEVLIQKDPLAYRDPKIFRPTFDHEGWMTTITKRIKRAGSRHEAIKHHTENYDAKYPFWLLAEVLDFSDISRLFNGLRSAEQRHIVEDFGLCINISALTPKQKREVKRNSPLARWLEQLTIVRNHCAHHVRLWNKSFTPAPTEALRTCPGLASLPPYQSERIFGTLIVMAALIRAASPGTSWPNKVTTLLNNTFLTNVLVHHASLGIQPKNMDSNGKVRL